MRPNLAVPLLTTGAAVVAVVRLTVVAVGFLVVFFLGFFFVVFLAAALALTGAVAASGAMSPATSATASRRERVDTVSPPEIVQLPEVFQRTREVKGNLPLTSLTWRPSEPRRAC